MNVAKSMRCCIPRTPAPPFPKLAGAVLASAGVAIVIVASAPPFAAAQTYTGPEALERAAALAPELEQTSGCDLTVHGYPQLDETTRHWLIAYSGTGLGCDDAGAALQRAGAELEIAFYRRPNADEVKELVSRMRASVRKGFACLIAFKGDPQFNDESTAWMVTYYTSGQQCDDAAEELERQGRELRVLFHRMR